jgi:myo-inositol 2-dehydrogenase / D-chiro-inositol 1-dehydrogenase
MNRRQFFHTGSAAASALLLLNPKTTFGYQANSAVRLGLLGCGGRGTYVATSFTQNTSAYVVALADLFPNQLAAARKHFDQLNTTLGHPPIDGKLIFHGPDAFRQISASPEIDLIQISTPPFFHVQHLEAAVASGKHVYCEKPLAIDVQQAQQSLEIAKRVKPDQSVDIGFQCRSGPPIAAIAKKIRAGALGKIASVVGCYCASALAEKAPMGSSADEYRLRNWQWDRALSGDILVEQNIHIIDLCNWILGAHPLKATATGARSILTHAGDCWDNFQVDFTYPGDVHLNFSSTQFGRYDAPDPSLRFYGSDGYAFVGYTGHILINGAEAWKWQNPSRAHQDPDQDNLAFADRDKELAFIDSITSGNSHNQIANGVESALTCMLGRMAAYQHREVTWEDLLAHGETYQLGFSLDQFA